MSFLRIKCGITGHEMPAKEAIVRQHISGKKFLRLAKEWKKPDEAQSTNRWLEKKKHKKEKNLTFRTFLETHTKHENMLYCKLTGRSVRNEEIHIQRHIKGKKFKKALDHCKQKLSKDN